MRITVLMENTSRNPELACEHGLSLLIETMERTVLFDAGQSRAFADNARKLGVDLKRVDFAVLSHGHYDHGGGIPRFLEENPTAPVHVHGDAFGAFYHDGKYIGLPRELANCGRVLPVWEPVELAPGICLVPCRDGEADDPVAYAGLDVCRDGVTVPDDFRHEQYLLIHEGGRRVVISGCSHRGITNICRRFQPDVLVGGFHFTKLDPAGEGRSALEAAAQTLLRFPGVYHTGHCTGEPQFAFLKSRMGSRLHDFAVGDVITI